MKKLALMCTMLVALVAFSAPDAEAQFCFKWVVFCDGIQVNSISGGQINSDWYHYDCANTAPMTGGRKGEAPISNVCPGGNGAGLIECNAAQGCPIGSDWHFVVDPPDGTLDMASGAYPGGSCWIDELAYTLQMGSCTGLKQRGDGPPQGQNRSSVQ